MRVLRFRDDPIGSGAAQPERYPTREEIREGIAGNLCRCSGYVKIEEAIQDAAGRLRGEREGHGEI